MRSEDFKNIAAGVQSIVMVIAVLVGGWWTLNTFGVLKEEDSAKAEYEKLKKELIDYRVVNISIVSEFNCASSGKGFILFSTVTLENVGNQTEVIVWPSQPLTYRPIKLEMGNNITLGGPRGHRLSEVVQRKEKNIRLKPKTNASRTFMAPVLEAGYYYISFYVDTSDAEQGQAEENEIAGPVAWATDSYIYIDESKCK